MDGTLRREVAEEGVSGLRTRDGVLPRWVDLEW